MLPLSQHKGLPKTDKKIHVILNPQGGHREEVKLICKTSVNFGGQPELKIWEQAMLENKKVNPACKTFLNKLLEVEFEPTPETLSIIWEDWNKEHEACQWQVCSRGIIRITTELKHPPNSGRGMCPFGKCLSMDKACMFNEIVGLVQHKQTMTQSKHQCSRQGLDGNEND